MGEREPSSVTFGKINREMWRREREYIGVRQNQVVSLLGALLSIHEIYNNEVYEDKRYIRSLTTGEKIDLTGVIPEAIRDIAGTLSDELW